MRIQTRFVTSWLFPIVLGAMVFLVITGFRILDPTNVAWLNQGDLATHYLGWVFFRNSGWAFPIGMNPAYGLELSSSIFFSDANPLLAFPFKLFSSVLTNPFQYFGLWLLTGYVLQAWFGWALVGLATVNYWLKGLGAALFAFSLPMIQFSSTHPSLGSHFLILAGLYLVLTPRLKKRKLAWGLLLATTALVHAYLLAMVALLWVADLLGRTTKRTLKSRSSAIEAALLLPLTFLMCWQAGYFVVGSDVLVPGFGTFSMNVLSIIDADGWSHILKDIPESESHAGVSGFQFLGLGMLVLALAAIPILVAGRVRIVGTIRKFPFLLAALTGLTLFAISNTVAFGPYVFEIPLPDKALTIANTFRASGRMFWPVYYALVFVIIYVIIRGYRPGIALSLLVFALAVQIVDSSAGWRGLRAKMMIEPKTVWESQLVDPFWRQAADKYQKVRWLMPENSSPRWKDLAAYAGRYGLATDAVYLARIDRAALNKARYQASESVRTGVYEMDALYVIDDAVVPQAILGVDRTADLLARVDGFNVLAPGWKKCAECTSMPAELELPELAR